MHIIFDKLIILINLRLIKYLYYSSYIYSYILRCIQIKTSKRFYSILGEFLSRIFTRNFMISGLKSFLFVPRQISNILYLAPFIFRGLSRKIRTFFNQIELNKFIYPTTLCYHLEQYVFCCDFYFFWFVFGLNSRFLIPQYVRD